MSSQRPTGKTHFAFTCLLNAVPPRSTGALGGQGAYVNCRFTPERAGVFRHRMEEIAASYFEEVAPNDAHGQELMAINRLLHQIEYAAEA